MLKRKSSAPQRRRAAAKAKAHQKTEAKTAPVRRRFVILQMPSARRPNRRNRTVTPNTRPLRSRRRRRNCCRPTASRARALPLRTVSTVDLTETIKTLVHLAQEHGYVTYDDINDILPDNLSPDDLDALLTQAAQPGRGNCHGPGRGRTRRTRQAARAGRKKSRTIRAWKFWTTRFACI